jgi:hypothetical protein
MLDAFRFNGETYREVRDDKTATSQAVAVLFLAGLGYSLGYTFRVGPFDLESIIVSIFTRVLISLLVGLLWAITTFLVGTKLFRGTATFWELARPLFFSAAPFTLFIFVAIPFHVFVGATDVIGGAIYAVVAAWGLIAGLVALKNAMGFGYDRGMLTYIVGWLALIAIVGFL